LARHADKPNILFIMGDDIGWMHQAAWLRPLQHLPVAGGLPDTKIGTFSQALLAGR